jgi:hypothetical protein
VQHQRKHPGGRSVRCTDVSSEPRWVRQLTVLPRQPTKPATRPRHACQSRISRGAAYPNRGRPLAVRSKTAINVGVPMTHGCATR